MCFNNRFDQRAFPALISIISIIYLSILFPGCSQSSIDPLEPPQPSLSFMQNNGCQSMPAYKSDVSETQLEFCIDYQYDGVGKLILAYRGAYLNCCLDNLTSDIFFNNQVIYIVAQEHLEGMGCRCNCQYDLDYEVESLPSGIYAIHIETRWDPDAQYRYHYYTLDFEIELPAEPVSETLCTEPEYH